MGDSMNLQRQHLSQPSNRSADAALAPASMTCLTMVPKANAQMAAGLITTCGEASKNAVH